MSRDRWLNLERSMAKQNADRFLRAPSAENMKMGKKEVLIGKRMGWDRGFWVLRVFKLDHLQPIKTLLFPNFYIFFTFILGVQFLLPQRANNGKGNSPNFKIGWDRGDLVPGTFKLGHLHPFELLLFQIPAEGSTYSFDSHSSYAIKLV